MKSGREGKRLFSRREVVGTVWGVSLVALFGQFSGALFEYLKPRIPAGGFGSKVTAGLAKEFKPGTVSYVQSGRFYISCLPDGGLLALWQRCTHLGCTVPWVKAKKLFMCPCHSSVFNPEGVVVSGPAPRPLDLFPIQIIGGEVIVDTSQPISRDKFDISQVKRV